MTQGKKNVIVFDTAAESSGALSVLHGFYREALEDKSINWIFVVSTPDLDESDNIKVLKFPQTKNRGSTGFILIYSLRRNLQRFTKQTVYYLYKMSV